MIFSKEEVTLYVKEPELKGGRNKMDSDDDVMMKITKFHYVF